MATSHPSPELEMHNNLSHGIEPAMGSKARNREETLSRDPTMSSGSKIKTFIHSVQLGEGMMTYGIKTASLVAIIFVATCGTTPQVHGAVITEHFNNYGSTDIDRLFGLSGGSGWASDWAGANSSNATGYGGNTSTSFTNPNYFSTGNQTDSDDGRGNLVVGNGSGVISTRAFASGLTGTIWVSALVRHASDTGGDVLFWFDSASSGGGADTFMGLRNGDVPNLRFDSGLTTAPELNSANTNLLFLAKVQMNVSGANDSIDVWIKNEADDLSSEAALGTALLSDSGSDAFGTELNFIGLDGGGGTSSFESIRISNEASAYFDVLGGQAVPPVPEPSSFLLLGLGALGLRCHTRRRRQRA